MDTRVPPPRNDELYAARGNLNLLKRVKCPADTLVLAPGKFIQTDFAVGSYDCFIKTPFFCKKILYFASPCDKMKSVFEMRVII